ncbi:MAG: hypothetical protein N2112_05635 [Gemmataceae bacterium]|nr:hypothetical protein [Gemmataceae bacterium]
MPNLRPNETGAFLHKYRLKKILRWSISRRAGRTLEGTLILQAQKGNETLRLKMVFQGLEEFRLQKRPNTMVIPITLVRLEHLQGLFFLNLDAYEDDGHAKVMDFRASDIYLAGRDLSYEELPPKEKKTP